MKTPTSRAGFALGLAVLVLTAPSAFAADEAPAPVFYVVDLSAPSAELIPLPSHSDIVTVARAEDAAGIDVNIAPGLPSYPGITFRLGVGQPDLSAFGYVEARLTNTSDLILSISMRLDSVASGATEAGTGTSAAYLKPGQSGVARVYFAHPKKGSAPISPNLLSHLFIFVGKNEKQPRSFRLESLTAGGKPGDVPPPRP